jgi:hypothetical protein
MGSPPLPPPGGGRGGGGIPSGYPIVLDPHPRCQAFLYNFFCDFFLKKTLTRCDFSDNLFVMKTQQMTVTLDNISLNTIGRARSLAIAGRSCVTCGKRADLFRDSLSVKEYNISGMCQICQDKFFVEAE